MYDIQAVCLQALQMASASQRRPWAEQEQVSLKRRKLLSADQVRSLDLAYSARPTGLTHQRADSLLLLRNKAVAFSCHRSCDVKPCGAFDQQYKAASSIVGVCRRETCEYKLPFLVFSWNYVQERLASGWYASTRDWSPDDSLESTSTFLDSPASIRQSTPCRAGKLFFPAAIFVLACVPYEGSLQPGNALCQLTMCYTACRGCSCTGPAYPRNCQTNS